MDKIVDYSLTHKKNAAVILISIAALMSLMGFSLYRYFDIGFLSPLEIFTELLLILVLAERAQAKILCEIDKKVFRITKKSLFGTKVYEVPYRSVLGVYRYAPKLISTVKFRNTYRLHSALDPRVVWTLAYQEKKGEKTVNKRIYFKAGEYFLEALNERLPNKVRIPEEQVVRDIILNK